MKETKLNDTQMFFNLVDENRKIASGIARNIKKIIRAQEELDSFLANEPTADDTVNGNTIDALLERLSKAEKRFLTQMIILSNENGNFLDKTYLEDTEELAVEVITILETLRITDALFGKFEVA